MGGYYLSIFVYKVGLGEILQLVSLGDPRQTVGGEIKGQAKFFNEWEECTAFSIADLSPY